MLVGNLLFRVMKLAQNWTILCPQTSLTISKPALRPWSRWQKVQRPWAAKPEAPREASKHEDLGRPAPGVRFTSNSVPGESHGGRGSGDQLQSVSFSVSVAWGRVSEMVVFLLIVVGSVLWLVPNITLGAVTECSCLLIKVEAWARTLKK